MMGKHFATDDDRRQYNRNHYNVVRVRGKAAEHRCDCGEDAAEWAQVHGKDGSSAEHFIAMCRPCHQKYDGRWNDQERAKVSATLKAIGHMPPDRSGTKQTAEHTRKIAEANRGLKRSEETKQKLRDAWVRRKARMAGDAK